MVTNLSLSSGNNQQGRSVTQSTLSHPKYRPDIDGLRAVSVLAVVIFHAFPELLKGGFIGVDVFFVISGYLISTILFENLAKGTFSFTEFYARRIKRIFPALFLVLITCFVIGWFTLPAAEFKQLGKHILSGAGFLSNITLWNEAGYFDTSAEVKPLLHLWSLGIEEQFYFFWPIILWICWKQKLNLLAITVLFIAISFYLNVTGIRNDQVATFYSPQTRFWELLCGSLLAWLTLYKREAFTSFAAKFDLWIASFNRSANNQNNKNTLANFLSIFGLILLVYGFLRINKELSFPGKWALVPVLASVFLISAGTKAWVNQHVLSHRIVVWFGLISFPLYLWHWPLLSFARIIDSEIPSVTVRLLAVILSVLLAWLTYRFIETPIRTANHNKIKVSVLVILVTIAGAMGLVTFLKDGLGFRAFSRFAETLHDPAARHAEHNFVVRHHQSLLNESTSSNKPVILIVGDSYVHNWSAALASKINLDQYDVIAISYLGCDVKLTSESITSIPYANENAKNCELFSSVINNRALYQRLAAVMLVSFRPFEQPKNPFRFEILRWLKNRNSQTELFVFGNYFQLSPTKYVSCEKLMLRSGQDAEVCLNRSDYPAVSETEGKAVFYPRDLDFKYVDLIKLHCAYDKKDCAFQSKEGMPYMLDWNHLSATFIEMLLGDMLKNKSNELNSLGLAKYFVNRQAQGKQD